MRWIAKILAVITLVLTLFPCNDGFAQYQSSDATYLSISTLDTQNHHSDEGDLCTPFCTCVCCASLVYVEKGTNIVQPEQMNQSVNKYFISDLTSGFIGRNFQPPKA
ncbi:MAG: hypothetical protein L3J45_09540 [Flavobacteriaceae bacterium]|nr:hypothetical protein [Flavobacteriaceae bacterium]